MAKKRKRAAKVNTTPMARGYLRDWNHNLTTMPNDEEIEVLRVYSGVYRWSPETVAVVDPMSGRMFRPTAWRPKKR